VIDCVSCDGLVFRLGLQHLSIGVCDFVCFVDDSNRMSLPKENVNSFHYLFFSLLYELFIIHTVQQVIFAVKEYLFIFAVKFQPQI